jgi:PhzF family phenazine biosynthesis protein
MTNVLKLAAFSQNGQGGNPAGVAFYEEMPSDEEMLSVAKQVGFSETAFLVKQGDVWRVRYFAPAMEIPFCGHATVALGAVLGERFGEGGYRLILNGGPINVRAERSSIGFSATLTFPNASSQDAPAKLMDKILAAFGLAQKELDPDFPVRMGVAGTNKHPILFVKHRETLADMKYDFDAVKALMLEHGLITISLLWRESDEVFHSRNAFASGGVYEDPATGAAAVALAGYFRDIRREVANPFTILQGEDMGMPSKLIVSFAGQTGGSVAVGGEVRHIQ